MDCLPSTCVGSNAPSGFCQSQATPGPIALKFSGLDPNTGQCCITAPWYTAHADYWNAWKEPAGSPDQGKTSDALTINDLSEDCLMAPIPDPGLVADPAASCGNITSTSKPPEDPTSTQDNNN
jgi:hypothetical protein